MKLQWIFSVGGSLLVYAFLFQLGPNATIGKNVVIGDGVRVRDSVILEGAVLQVGCFGCHSYIHI